MIADDAEHNESKHDEGSHDRPPYEQLGYAHCYLFFPESEGVLILTDAPG
jgi:hypothetical protein